MNSEDWLFFDEILCDGFRFSSQEIAVDTDIKIHQWRAISH
jgi:hypothetical protein